MKGRLIVIGALAGALPAGAQVQPVWQLGSSRHPTLGTIDFAVMRRPNETTVGNDKVYSRAYLSCQKDRGFLAIELTNTSSPTDSGGLQPASDPRLTCAQKATSTGSSGGRQPLAAKWEYNKLGDALARGFKPESWRECRSITVSQDVALGPGWSAKSTKVEFEIDPSSAELDPVFNACGAMPAFTAAAGTVPAETIAPAPAKSAPVQSAPAPAPLPEAAATPSTNDGAPWRPARTITIGKSNVRSGPSIDTPIVMQLHPGSVVQVQPAGKDWWKVRATNGTVYGFIRSDRLTFK